MDVLEAQTASGYLRVLQAAEYAAQMHRKQKRKGATETPYINHPLKVARLLAEVEGLAEEERVRAIMAGVLHDTIEDTAATAEELAKRFGRAVAEVVLEVSDDKSLDAQERKRLQIVNAPKKSRLAKLVKLADKTCNVEDVGMAPPADWSVERRVRYLDWAEAVVAGLRGTEPGLEARFDRALAQSRALLQGSVSESPPQA